MQRIVLQLAQPGMILAQPLHREDGILLAGAGYELTKAALSRFQQAGVSVLVVEGGDEDEGLASLEKIMGDLDSLFRRHAQNAFMMSIKKILARYYGQRIVACKAAIEAKIAEQEAQKAKEELEQETAEGEHE